MVSLRSTLIAAAALVAGAQAQYPIQPNSVPLSTRKSWCSSQTTQCPLICLDMGAGTPASGNNQCDSAALTYTCVCANNQTPNLTEYSLTLPYYMCVQYQANCVSACGLSNNQCSSKCQNDIKCGALNPKPANSTSSASASASPSSTTSSGPTLQTGFGDSGSASPPGSFATHSTSVQTSLVLAVSITGILIGPLFL